MPNYVIQCHISFDIAASWSLGGITLQQISSLIKALPCEDQTGAHFFYLKTACLLSRRHKTTASMMNAVGAITADIDLLTEESWCFWRVISFPVATPRYLLVCKLCHCNDRTANKSPFWGGIISLVPSHLYTFCPKTFLDWKLNN